MADTKSYGERVLENIVAQCAVRGIPAKQVDDFLSHVEEKLGVAVTAMNGSQLKRFQQSIDGHFRSYLGGRKRAPGAAGEAWPHNASPAAALEAAKAGISIGEIEGTGRGGTVTKADVASEAKKRAEANGNGS